MTLTNDTAASKLEREAEAYADERMASVGKLWTRHLIREELVTAHIAGFTAAKVDSVQLLESFTGHAVRCPRERYHVNCPTCTCPMVRDPSKTYGTDVEYRAEEVPNYLKPQDPPPYTPFGGDLPLPTAQEILRACKPSPELVRLLAENATQWARVGQLDDAIAALSMALCARSAWIEGRALVYHGPVSPEVPE